MEIENCRIKSQLIVEQKQKTQCWTAKRRTIIFSTDLGPVTLEQRKPDGLTCHEANCVYYSPGANRKPPERI